jgi:anti-sigma factor RsiW
MTRDPFRELDAAYVLGALSSDERREYEVHLVGCGECAAGMRDLAGLPGLLATVPRAVAESDAPDAGAETPPETLLPALVRRVRRETRRRRWSAGLVAASALAAIALGGIAWQSQSDGAQTAGPSVTASSAPTPTATRADTAMAPVVASPVQARIAMTGVAWGTRLDLTCTYAEGDGYAQPGSAAYVLVVRGRDGGTEEVASWRALPGRTMRLSGASAYSLTEIAAVEVRTAQGTALLELHT